MVEDPKQLILARLARELNGQKRIALGPGVPQRIVPFLPGEIQWIDLSVAGVAREEVDLAVVEAVEVSSAGDLASDDSTRLGNLTAERWIVAATLVREDGEPRLVRQCRYPVQKERCVDLVVTEMGVIEIDPEVGLILREVSPGVSSDDVRARVRTSIHVADDLQLLRV